VVDSGIVAVNARSMLVYELPDGCLKL